MLLLCAPLGTLARGCYPALMALASLRKLFGAVALLGLLCGLAAADGPPVRPAWLGVWMEDAPAGVLVSHVVRGSPAEAAGLRAGDRITRVDNAEVREAAQVIRAVASHSPRAGVGLELARAERRVVVRAELRENPGPERIMRMEHVGLAAPPLAGAQPIGQAPASLAALRGRVVVLDFWATWCGPCRLVAPRLSALQAKFGVEGLRVVGVTTDTPDRAATFSEVSGIKYPSLSDPGSIVARAYHVASIPSMFVVDRRGVVREVFVGYDPAHDAALETLVRSLLAEPGEPAVGTAAEPRAADAGPPTTGR